MGGDVRNTSCCADGVVFGPAVVALLDLDVSPKLLALLGSRFPSVRQEARFVHSVRQEARCVHSVCGRGVGGSDVTNMYLFGLPEFVEKLRLYASLARDSSSEDLRMAPIQPISHIVGYAQDSMLYFRMCECV